MPSGLGSLILLAHGKWVKWNNNDSYKDTDNDSVYFKTAEAFAHFSLTVTGGCLLVCDIQGVDFTCSDLACLSFQGNMGSLDTGTEGISLWMKAHHCNEVCRELDIEGKTGIGVHMSTLKAPQRRGRSSKKPKMEQ